MLARSKTAGGRASGFCNSARGSFEGPAMVRFSSSKAASFSSKGSVVDEVVSRGTGGTGGLNADFSGTGGFDSGGDGDAVVGFVSLLKDLKARRFGSSEGALLAGLFLVASRVVGADELASFS